MGTRTFSIQDEAIIYDLVRDTVHYLNRSARMVWEQCDGSQSVAEVRRSLQARFVRESAGEAEGIATITRGIDETLDMLLRDGLISITEVP